MSGPDTIFALSSGQVPAAIAVIRISGPRAMEAARALTTRDLPPPRKAGLRRFHDPVSGELLDEALLLCFPGPRTETGEDMVELQCHGSRAVQRGIEAALAAMPGLRLAEPGEFTRRAFLNGHIDLAGIEGLGDLLAAETALQRRAAMAMLGGGLSRRVAEWTGTLRRLAAQVEAGLDFADEGDVAARGADLAQIAAGCAEIAGAMAHDLARPSAERLREGIRVAVGGPPNAGKSSLFNILVGREAAIVSPHPGTTRDVIEATVAFEGIPFLLADSAGLRESGEEIERIGIGRAEALIASADILLWLGATADAPPTEGGRIQIHPKADLADAAPAGPDGIAISTLTGQGIDELVARLCAEARALLPVPGDYALSRRQRAAMERAVAALRDVERTDDEVLIGECLRQALGALDELTGRSTTDAVLAELFRGFCVGK